MGEHRELKVIPREVRYNQVRYFYKSKVAYVFAFVLAFIAIVSMSRWMRWAALIVVLAGLIPHTMGIVDRCIIMGRPPMTNLYATFLFVAWAGVLLLLVVDLIQKNSMGLFAASFCGFVMLMISDGFGNDGDTMGKMVAVLRSNFWLSTHVVAITLGYVGCIAAGLIAHMYLFTAAFAPKRTEMLKSIKIAVFAVLGFGLTLSFLGTMLGGVWADQSWGRFWGWDPKENGALLIVIWCSILFHARLGKMIGDVGFAAGTALGIIVVMLAWLGVNLLNVGLHSYGFTSGLAGKLYTYIYIQTGLIAVLAPLAKYRLPKGEAAALKNSSKPKGEIGPGKAVKGPYKDDGANLIYQTLFCDRPELHAPADGEKAEKPWPT
ncbi:MAG: cytochrome c biogenesis protein CcsA, partial [Verrucomicrobiota bacterium]